MRETEEVGTAAPVAVNGGVADAAGVADMPNAAMTGVTATGVAVTQDANERPWWREAVVYQVYIRSFADANGDGIGDISGVRDRLPYLAALGVDALWFNPWYPSPLADAGYNITDYRSIDPAFGTLWEAEQLIEEARALGIRTIVDIVPNHVSSEHPWFREALAAPAGSPARERFWFRRGTGDAAELPPNGWQSIFGGPAWTRVGDGGA